jgi:hypothetical protein
LSRVPDMAISSTCLDNSGRKKQGLDRASRPCPLSPPQSHVTSSQAGGKFKRMAFSDGR